MKPIYEPKGRAKEYGDLALNIYTGCPHACYYCFAPNVLRKEKERFHSVVEPRKDIVSETKKQLENDHITGKLIHLCFTCDPYPAGHDTSVTREIIKLLKEYGNHVQILTKGDGSRDFDILDENDWYGITISTATDSLANTAEPNAIRPAERIEKAFEAKARKIKTWVSFEPVIDTYSVLRMLEVCGFAFNKIKIGKLNYHQSDIDWIAFGIEAERICKKYGLNYYIKEGLRKEMEK